MASYFSTAFFGLLLPILVLAYGVMPKRARWVVLLLGSYAFAWVLSGRLVAFMLISTVSVYALGLLLQANSNRREQALANGGAPKKEIRARCKTRGRWILVAGIALNLGILVALKYLSFFDDVLVGWGFGHVLPALSIGVPIGISFYTLMAISYLVDIYREQQVADRHLGHVALYLSFFPYIMEGPIARYHQVAPALWEGTPLRSDNLYRGSLRMLVGFVKKTIVADRLNTLVGTVFDNHGSYDGGTIALAAILYTMQLYCDFAGTMDVALGMGCLFGVELPENFNQPFFSVSAAEFWQRWHITLGAWFKDYVYYPVAFSKPCKALTKRARKRFGRVMGPALVGTIALFCVWLGNGLWHGAGTQYVAFGMYYFVILSLGSFVEPVARSRAAKRGINRDAGILRVLRIARTLVIVFIGELIFRADSFAVAQSMLGRVVSCFSVRSLMDGTVLTLGLDLYDLVVIGIGLVCVLVLDLVKERGFSPWKLLCSQGAVVRWTVWVLILAAVVVFGAYGFGYEPVDPMYAQY